MMYDRNLDVVDDKGVLDWELFAQLAVEALEDDPDDDVELVLNESPAYCGKSIRITVSNYEFDETICEQIDDEEDDDE